MTWTLTNLVIEIIAGIVGGHAIAAVAKEHSFGALGHTITGALGGAFSGYFLQRSPHWLSTPPARLIKAPIK
jgi:uncharacterized membrane protein YeaQ/YmgE (transglycosylase-associated protein family)